MIAWMAYAALVAVLIAAGALAIERLVASTGRPRRFVWLAAVTLAVVVPLAGGLREPESPEASPAAGPSESSLVENVRLEGGQTLVPPLPLQARREWAQAAAIAWGAASAALLAALCTVLCFVFRARRRWQQGRLDGVNVCLSRRFGPALVGLLRPRIVVPRWILGLDRTARTTILRHEQEHARAGDQLALLYGGLIAAALPWSPAIWWMCRRLRAAVEMDCDRRVIAGGIGAADYGAVLLHAGARSHARWGFAPAMSQPGSLLERRLKTMNEKTTKLNPVHGLLLAGAAAIALAIACDTPSPTQLNDAIDEVVPEGRDGEPAPSATGDAAEMPLVFVDGKRASSEDALAGSDGTMSPVLQALDITRIEILKGAAATGIYGDEAAQGVIQIFTTEDEGSGDDSSFGFEVELPAPAGEWNANLSFQVGMPLANIASRAKMLQPVLTSGIGGGEMSFEGDGSFRGWFTLSGDTRYGEVEHFLELLAAAAGQDATD